MLGGKAGESMGVVGRSTMKERLLGQESGG